MYLQPKRGAAAYRPFIVAFGPFGASDESPCLFSWKELTQPQCGAPPGECPIFNPGLRGWITRPTCSGHLSKHWNPFVLFSQKYIPSTKVHGSDGIGMTPSSDSLQTLTDNEQLSPRRCTILLLLILP